jgi:IS5 family transposase
MYMQYFIGFSSFSDKEPFDPSLFVEFRKRLGAEQNNAINEKTLHLYTRKAEVPASGKDDPPLPPLTVIEESLIPQMITSAPSVKTHEGKLIVDATACPQDISYPTDLNMLNDSREKAEELIDFLYQPSKHDKKPRTYRENARKAYLKTAQMKRKTKKDIRNAVRRQLGFLKRDIKSIYKLLISYEKLPFDRCGHYQSRNLLAINLLKNENSKKRNNKLLRRRAAGYQIGLRFLRRRRKRRGIYP